MTNHVEAPLLPELTSRLRAAGLLRRYTARHISVAAAVFTAHIAGWIVFFTLGNSWWQLLVAMYLGLCFGQAAIIGHDAAHGHITANHTLNHHIGRLFANLLTGVSYSLWRVHHTAHHREPNHLVKDPDVANRPVLFDVSQRPNTASGWSRFVHRHQAPMFTVVTLLEGLRLQKYGLMVARKGVLDRYRLLELVLVVSYIAVHVISAITVLSPVLAVTFLVVKQATGGLYLGLLFAPNHKGMPVRSGEDGLDWVRKQTLTARNIGGGLVVDVAYGGLNYQIEHHVMPGLSRFALARAAPIVEKYCREQHLSYVTTSVVGSYTAVYRELDRVSKELA